MLILLPKVIYPYILQELSSDNGNVTGNGISLNSFGSNMVHNYTNNHCLHLPIHSNGNSLNLGARNSTSKSQSMINRKLMKNCVHKIKYI